MENFLYEKFQKLNLFKKSEDIENGYNLSLEQALKKTLNNIYNNISVDDKSSNYNIFIYNIFIEIYKILSNNKVMNIVAKILIFFIIILFGLSVYGIIYFIFFLVKTII